ncbi:hypothetical protein [Winogradskyella sp.]|uniref:hypothetical protein n=1 Tax=Winogradskyella sp. TaxID=1883156 RepID=UPI003BAC175A
MINTIIPLVYDWSMGVIMIGVFALVCIILIGVLISSMSSGGKDKKDLQDN